MNFHQTANAFEAALWTVIGCGFAWNAFRTTDAATRYRCLIAAVAFLLFGISDVIEIFTGAWWRPWWLLLLKVVCVLTLLRIYFDYHFRRGDRKLDS